MNSEKTAAVRRAILVENDDGVRRSLHLLLRWRGYDVQSFATAGDALASAEARAADVLVTDYRLDEGNGVDLLKSLRSMSWPGRAVLITGYPTSDLHEAAVEAGFVTVLAKPLQQRALLNALADNCP